MRTAPVLTLVTAILTAWGLAGCRSEPDPRIATPQATVETVLRANHLLGATRPAPRSDPRAAGDRGLPPSPDIEAMALAVWDYDRDDPSSRAMGGFVAGMLAAHQRSLSYEVTEEGGAVYSGSRPVYLRRSWQGWHLVLRDTVPDEIRQDLIRGRQRTRQRFDR